MKLLKNSQKGFALLHILPAFVLVAAIAFVGGSVYQAQINKQEAARLAAEAEDAKKLAELSAQKKEVPAEEEKVEVPAPAPEQKPVATAPAPTKTTTTTKTTETKPSYTYIGISSVSHVVDGDNVTITATLPGSYTGTCGIKVKLLPNYDKYHYKDGSFSNSNTCSVIFSKAALSADGTSWRAFASWRSSDYTKKGDHGGYDFNL